MLADHAGGRRPESHRRPELLADLACQLVEKAQPRRIVAQGGDGFCTLGDIGAFDEDAGDRPEMFRTG